jgi:hypothetical protein
MKLQIKVDDEGNIVDSCFKTFGCGSAIASSSVATEWVKGKSLDDVLTIKNSDIAKHLSLPPVKLHCSMLAGGCEREGGRSRGQPAAAAHITAVLSRTLVSRAAAAAHPTNTHPVMSTVVHCWCYTPRPTQRMRSRLLSRTSRPSAPRATSHTQTARQAAGTRQRRQPEQSSSSSVRRRDGWLRQWRCPGVVVGEGVRVQAQQDVLLCPHKLCWSVLVD